MIPSTGQIMEKRHACRRRIRYTGLYLLIAAVVFASYWAIDSALSGRWYVESSAVAFFLALAVPVAPLWLCDRWLARLLVPMPIAQCPGCGYSFNALNSSRCPECGVAVPPVFLRSDDASQA